MAGGFDTSGFVLPENNFGGLYKIAGDLRAENQRKALAQQKAEQQKIVGEKYIGNQFGKDNLYTGTPFDPVHTAMISNAKNQAYEMFDKGADLGDVQLAISPLIDQAAKYSTFAKDYATQKKAVLQQVSGMKGIDKDKLSAEMDNQAFPKDANGNPDISKFDPNTNYADQALRTGNVYTNDAISGMVAKSGKNVLDNNVKTVGADGRTVQTKLDMTVPNFMQPETDARGRVIGLVPKYQVATDEDNALVHNFGEQGDHPVRMVTQDVFDAMPPVAKAYILQETKSALAKSGANVTIDSPQAETLAKAIAYDELKNSTKGYSTLKTTSVDKAAPTDKFYAHRAFDILHGIVPDNSNYNAGYVIDRTGSTKPIPLQSGGRIENGTVYDKDGNLMKDGTINIDRNQLPAEFTNVLTANKINLPKNTNLDIKDGVIIGVHTPSGVIDRDQLQDMEKQAQVKNKITPQKTFGTKKVDIQSLRSKYKY
jgi:hypothetical protein